MIYVAVNRNHKNGYQMSMIDFYILDSANYDTPNLDLPNYDNQISSNDLSQLPADIMYDDGNVDTMDSLDYGGMPSNMNPPAMDPLEYPFNSERMYPNSGGGDPPIYFNSDDMMPNNGLR